MCIALIANNKNIVLRSSFMLSAKSSIFKMLAIIVGVLGGIGGIVLGFLIPSFDLASIAAAALSNTRVETSFNISLMLITWIFTIFPVMIFLGFYFILEKLEAIEFRQVNNSDSTSAFKNINVETKPSVKTPPQVGEWKCSQCGKINKNYVGTCGCGTSKVE